MLVLFRAPISTTQIYTLSLHDALPISYFETTQVPRGPGTQHKAEGLLEIAPEFEEGLIDIERSEEHTSELQSPMYLVCRLLLEKKKHHTHTASKVFLPSAGHEM